MKNESYKDDFFMSVLELAKQESVKNQDESTRFVEKHNAKYIQDVITSVKEQILQGGQVW